MTLTPITYDDMRPGCYDPKARARRHGRELGRSVDVLPDAARASAARRSSKAPTRSSGWRASRRTTTGWSRSGAATRVGASSRSRSSRSGTSTLAVAEVRRNAARGVRAVCFSELPYHLGLPTIHSGYWDPFFAACADTGTVVAMHIGSSSKMPAASPDAPPSVSATPRVRQRDVVAHRLPDVRAPRAVPEPQAALRREPDRLDPVRAAAGRPGVGRQPGLGADQAHPRAAVDLLLPERLRLLDQRPARARIRSTRSASTT